MSGLNRALSELQPEQKSLERCCGRWEARAAEVRALFYCGGAFSV